ncbi:hypothetical protein I317_01270 [Kwoniella heveanensis CBS 569]|nr:hypothetical protein I317_01270 [Kwoniella heveanensis CBS 569]
MPILPNFLSRRAKDPSSSSAHTVPPPPITIYYLSSPSPAPYYAPLRPVPPPSSPRALPTPTLLFSLTHPHPSTSRATSFFLSCIPDPIGFLYHSSTFIAKHLSLSAGGGNSGGVNAIEWRHQLIQLELENKEGLAATSGGKIGVSLKWVENVMTSVERGERSVDGAVKEFKGVLLHELVHTIQHDGHGTTPGWLIESIADYVRLLAGLDPPHWRKSGSGKKERGWEDGYDVGARFLEWLSGTEKPSSIGGAVIPEVPHQQPHQQHPLSSLNATPTATTTSTGTEARPTQITQGMLEHSISSGAGAEAGRGGGGGGGETDHLPRPGPGNKRPGPYPDLVRLMDARLKYEKWDDDWWKEMTGYDLETLWNVYVDYYR